MSHEKAFFVHTVVGLMIMLGCVSSVTAQQLIKVQGGSSNLLEAQGASLDFQNGRSDASLGAGFIGGRFQLGTRVQTRLGDDVLTVGDEPLQIELPTDIFQTSHYFLTRGVSLRAHRRGFEMVAFGGMTALGTGTPFFEAARSDTAAGIVLLDIPISQRLHAYSRNVLSSEHTFIEGFDYRLRPWLKFGGAAGIGSDQPYGALSAELDRGWLNVKSALIGTGDRFRRITVQAPIGSEYNGGDVVLTAKPARGLVLVAGHQNLLQPQSDSRQSFLRATVDQVQAGFDFAQFRWGGGVFHSRLPGTSTTGEAAWLSRPITRRLEAGTNYFHSQSGTGKPSSVISGTLRATVSPRLSLLQLISNSNGQTSVSFGGSYLSNHFTIGVDYQTVYVPFLAQPFKPAMGITLQVKPFGGIELNGQTFVGPDGRTRYTASGSTLLNERSHLFAGNSSGIYKIDKFVIRGRVVGREGQPVVGAALLIGDEVLLTNSAGQFFTRKRGTGTYPLKVAFEQFLNPAHFELVSCPSEVIALKDETSPEVLIVLQPEGTQNKGK